MEIASRELSIAHFLRQKKYQSIDMHMRSLTARIWYARR